MGRCASTGGLLVAISFVTNNTTTTSVLMALFPGEPGLTSSTRLDLIFHPFHGRTFHDKRGTGTFYKLDTILSPNQLSQGTDDVFPTNAFKTMQDFASLPA